MTFDIWSDITGTFPSLFKDRYIYDTADDSITYIPPFPIGMSPLGNYHPPFGTLFYAECEDLNLKRYTGTGTNSSVNISYLNDYPGCCTLAVSDFSVVKTNNTSPTTPNGTIVITCPILDINDYEASIDGGDTYVSAVSDAITFDELPAGSYSIIIKGTGICSVTTSATIADNIIYPTPLIEETTLPSLYSPVFYPIEVGFTMEDNTATVKNEFGSTFLEAPTADSRDYLATLPIIRLFDNEDYAGTYKIFGVNDPITPTRFYLDMTFISEQTVKFIPFDRQIFQLFGEVNFNDFKKIADISVYPDESGEYKFRIEAFLQSIFRVNSPVNNGIENILLKKYYISPLDFDMSESPTILNALFSAIPDFTDFITDLKPIGPAPINFINEQTQKGFPVLFSYLNPSSGRIINITSSDQTDIVSNSEDVYIPALPLNTYTLTWINPLGAIGDLIISPDLPEWITLETSPADTILLTIDTGIETPGGDYDGEDYDGEDYLTGGVNAIVGCYEFFFYDGEDILFTLNICIYPIQKSNQLCPDNIANIAWVNREGGWSSYVFDGKKTYGKDVATVNTYKLGTELKRSSVENVYDVVEINIANKPIRDLKFISSLRQSIQAYLYDDRTLQWSIPIIIDKDSFPVYSVPFKQIQVSDKFSFRIANEIIIQQQ